MALFNSTTPQGQDNQQQVNAVDRLRAKYGIADSWRSVTPGAYVAEIQAVYPDHPNQRIYFAHDITEGEHAGAFAGEDVPDWAHRTMFSMKDSWGFEQLVRNLMAVTESNPGFDAHQVFYDEDWGAFVGKRVGIVLQEREYLNKYNELTSALNVMRYIPVAEVESTPVPPIKRLNKEVV